MVSPKLFNVGGTTSGRQFVGYNGPGVYFQGADDLHELKPGLAS